MPPRYAYDYTTDTWYEHTYNPIEPFPWLIIKDLSIQEYLVSIDSSGFLKKFYSKDNIPDFDNNKEPLEFDWDKYAETLESYC